MSTADTVNSSTKIAIVTGGSRGLGRSTVESLAKRGVDSIFTFHSNRAESDNVIARVRALGAKAFALQLDTGDIGSFGPFAARVTETLRAIGAERFDYLVNNAGDSLRKPFAEITESEFDAAYRVHFKGVFFLTQKLLPLICDGGRIVNISTLVSRVAFPGSSAYASMKGAVEVLTRCLAKELGPRGIAVNTVAPGPIATDFGGGMVRDSPQVSQRVADMAALGRVGQPDDIGPMIAALLSDENRWVNGQRIEVSGGIAL
jgi:NAD(P)-dependent dehydrogenase (short-subunit alcohol dehydrogenase family)